MRAGLDLEAAAKDLGLEPWPPERRRAAVGLEEKGRLGRASGRIWIPEASWPVADGIIAELNPGGRIPLELETRSLKLLTHEVMPAFK